MCCSIRAAVFFLASVHIFFSVTQLVYILPVAVGSLGEKVLESSMAFLFCILFFATGFMTFRGADEESAELVRLGAFCLALVIILRFILLSTSLMLVEKLPEASFLYVYGTPTIPIMFTVILYLLYLAILFCYYKELRYESTSSSASGSGGMHRSTSSYSQHSQLHHYHHHHHQTTSSPFCFQSPTPILRSHMLSHSSTLGSIYSPTTVTITQTPP